MFKCHVNFLRGVVRIYSICSQSPMSVQHTSLCLSKYINLDVACQGRRTIHPKSDFIQTTNNFNVNSKMASPLPSSLSSLSPREAITDALYRAISGFDHNDVSMFNSAFISSEEDVIFDLSGTMFNGLESIRKGLLDFVGPMDTTHLISNVRVDLKDGEKKGRLGCYALAQHCEPGKGAEVDGKKYLAASEYWIDLVQDEKDGSWKIKTWVMKIIWTQGDASVLQRSG